MQTAPDQGMTDEQLLRYSRHILLDEIGIEGQQKILKAHALVIGAGGLGSPVLMYLASAGVGHITVVDNDTVDLTNLQRQIAHTQASVGQAKVSSAAVAMAAINSEVRITALQLRADAAQLNALVAQADVVLDCCDNFATRHAVNAACVKHGVPLVSGAAIRFDGQVSVHDARLENTPCYACMQAAEALKLLAGVGIPLVGRLQMLDARAMEWTEIRTLRDPTCAVCG
jgi:molybdopterin-synthase adenylyltransferase